MKKKINLMTKVFARIALTLILTSCSKEPAKPECETMKYGTITVSNSSSNPYNIYIDGTFIVELAGKNISSAIKINEGNSRKLYAKQVSGYLLYPTEKSTNFNVISCSDYSWQVP